jgi:hypothetical protein
MRLSFATDLALEVPSFVLCTSISLSLVLFLMIVLKQTGIRLLGNQQKCYEWTQMLALITSR